MDMEGASPESNTHSRDGEVVEGSALEPLTVRRRTDTPDSRGDRVVANGALTDVGTYLSDISSANQRLQAPVTGPACCLPLSGARRAP